LTTVPAQDFGGYGVCLAEYLKNVSLLSTSQPAVMELGLAWPRRFRAADFSSFDSCCQSSWPSDRQISQSIVMIEDYAVAWICLNDTQPLSTFQTPRHHFFTQGLSAKRTLQKTNVIECNVKIC
jgi:hypothetical protein